MVAAFPVAEINNRRRPILRVALPDSPQTTPRQCISHITPTLLASTNLSVRFFRWYRRTHTACDAVEVEVRLDCESNEPLPHIGDRQQSLGGLFRTGRPTRPVWSSNKMMPEWTGAWDVEVVDGSGRIIGRGSFIFEAPL